MKQKWRRLFNKQSPLKQTVEVFDFAKIIDGGLKKFIIDGSYAKFIAKSISENHNRLAFVVWELFLKKTERG